MMAGRAPPEAQHRSLQSSLLFMQQEHANTLKCLHEEISHLQKKCQDVTFQLAMNTTSTVDEDKYREQIKKLEKKVDEKSKQSGELMESVDKKDKKIKMLEQQLHAQERKYQDELKARGQSLLALRQELESKSNNIAYLTTQLHQMKVREVTSSDRRASIDNQRQLSDRDSVSPISPVPPPIKDSAPRIHRRYKPSKTVPSVENNMHAVPIAPPSRGKGSAGRRLPVRPDSQQEVLDPAVFLHLRTREPEMDIKPVPMAPVLPPINSSNSAAENSARPFMKRQVTLPKSDVGPSSTIEVELESLAVDQVTGKETKLRQAQEYQGLDG